MAEVGALDDDGLLARLAEAQGRELAALGFTMSFGPVADVHTRPDNPIIGDRAFATTPDLVLRRASAWADGLARGGVLSCAKHFPGHGDTELDSHRALPSVNRSRDDLDSVELVPFRGLARRVPAMMSAHVVYAALDAEQPATLSRAICTDLLRGELGFQGVLFSDAMEMRAIRAPLADACVAAIAAGCDAVLVTGDFERAEEALDALIAEAERSPAFRARVFEAEERGLAMRRRQSPAPLWASPAELEAIFAIHEPLVDELRARLEAQIRT